MEGNQHNDNLERFFKASLKNYAPTPSDDFWSRMETAIPPKPSFWLVWRGRMVKWAGLGLVLLALGGLAVHWRNDKLELAKLKQQLEANNRQMQALEESSNADKSVQDLATSVAPETAAAEAQKAEKTDGMEGSFKAQSALPLVNNTRSSNATNAATQPRINKSNGRTANDFSKQTEKAVNNPPNKIQVTENQIVAENESPAFSTEKALEIPVQPADFTATTESGNELQNVELAMLPSLSTLLPIKDNTYLLLQKHAPLFKSITPLANQKSYPRISVESGLTGFAMPLSRLYEGDTLYAGRVRPSFSTGLLVNYEINPSTALQGGYMYKDVRTTRMFLRYNSFPMMLVKKWSGNRNFTIEAKTGVIVNSLLNVRTSTDGLNIRGLRRTWLGWQGSFGLGIRLGDQVSLITGPSFGWALTPIARSKRTWEAGLGANLRYQF